jgi:hypothetical protein
LLNSDFTNELDKRLPSNIPYFQDKDLISFARNWLLKNNGKYRIETSYNHFANPF